MRITDKYYFFWNTIFSQWYSEKDEFLIEEDDNKFYTAEHYMMYHKAKTFGDTEIMKKCLKKTSPKVVKSYGRQVKNFDNHIWDNVKFDIVVKGNYLKFTQNQHLLKKLINNKDKIFVEASPVDRIWGIGLHFDNDDVLDESKWKGENLLGKALNKTLEKIEQK